MSKKEIIHLISAIILILGIGLSTGYTLGYFQGAQSNFTEIKEVSEQNAGITTIKFLELKNGLLKGEIDGQGARIAYDTDNIRDFQPGETFEIPIYQVRLGQYYSARDLPEGMQFIASKQGKYYYSVLDPRAFKITPKNRLYFAESSEAEKKGYIPPK